VLFYCRLCFWYCSCLGLAITFNTGPNEVHFCLS
jgi:hypothetical protein